MHHLEENRRALQGQTAYASPSDPKLGHDVKRSTAMWEGA
jgi:hypothetical protein